MRAAYYNENDPVAAAILRALISQKLITDGDVDERSIEDVKPADLRGYEQCHFFAGIGGWAYALALAGWPRGRPVWTGSCPCQPFSQAGKGAGFDDQRHLWPAFYHLIRECRPAEILGEQVASKDADPWVDLVHADMEAVDYAFGCVPFPSAGVGAPHIRDRNYWVAHANDARLEGWSGAEACAAERIAGASGVVVGLADADGRDAGPEWQQRGRQHLQRNQDGAALRLANADGGIGGQGCALDRGRNSRSDALAWPRSGGGVVPDGERTGPANGFWRAADWLACRDGRWRPVESGTFPLAHGIPARVGRLRGYGNAINAYAAAEFAKAYLESASVLKVAA